MSGTKPFEYGILIQFKRYTYIVQIAIDIDSAAIAKRQTNNERWSNWDFYVTKSDLDKVAKIDRSTSSAWVGDKDRNMIFNCNFNSKTLIVTFADGKTVTFQGQ